MTSEARLISCGISPCRLEGRFYTSSKVVSCLASAGGNSVFPWSLGQALRPFPVFYTEAETYPGGYTGETKLKNTILIVLRQGHSQ